MKVLRYGLYSILFLLVFVGVFALVVIFTDSWATQFPDEMEVEVNTHKAKRAKAAPTDTLRVMTYNVKFGGARIDFFFDCFGDRVHMKASEVNANLRALADKIKQYDPHILLLQEVDFEAKRSANVNQYQRLMELADMPYGV
ncbi:MAG: endonuclease/exonuclease/phosphatase family protein, partial [Bacteroidota bacterium]